MASITGNGSKGHHKFTLEVNQTSQSTTNNTSTLSFTFKISPITTSWNWEQWGSDISYTVTIAGTKYTGTIPNYDGYSTVTLKSGTLTVTHNADGNKSISYSLSVKDISGQSYTSGNASASGTLTLTTIPRYATSVHSLKSRTETAITMNWSSDSNIDYVWYSTDWGTTWIAVGTANAKSGTYTISKPSNGGTALAPNTTYNIITRVRRKESQLTTNSSKLSVTTYDYPYCTSAPSFTIGNAVKLEFYNPLGRSIGWYMYGDDGSAIAWTTTTGTSYTGVSGAGSVANMYKSIPTKKSGNYSVKVTYGSIERTKTGGTYSIKGTEVPTVGTFAYFDNNQQTLGITGNKVHIIQNYSNLIAQVGDATANNGAGGIASYTVECNGKKATKSATANFNTFDMGTVRSADDVDLKLTVTDTRGLSSSKTIKVTMLEHYTPSADVTLQRLNNYEDETYLTVDGIVASLNSKNTVQIKYRYKVSGGTYNSYIIINDGQKYTLSLSKEKSYVFNIVVTDALGSTYTGEYALNKGVFPLFIDTEKNSVGVNCFPSGNNDFEVDGLISANSMKCKNLLYTPYTESNKLTQTATRDDYTVTTGYYCRLEKDKKYTFSCKSDSAWGGGNGTDTVEVFLLKDKAYDTIISIVGNPKTFIPTASGVYFLRCDVNKMGTTHSFWDFQIEEGSVATEYVEAKQFNYQEQYFQWEHKVGYWFDGKPIYRQIVSLGSSHFGTGDPPSGMNINIPHNIPNIKDIVKTEEIWCTNNQYRHFPTNFYGNEQWDGHYYCTATDICFEVDKLVLTRLITATTFFYIILYYTKTTD